MLKRHNWKLLFRLAASITLVGWFVITIKWQEIFNALTGFEVSWLFVAIVWIIASVLVSVEKWRIILEAQGLTLPFRELWQTYWAGLFLNNFLPSSIGGDALRILWVGKSTGDHPGATASVVIERTLATTGLSVVGLIGCFSVASTISEVKTMFELLIIGSVALFCLLLYGKLPPLLQRKDNRLVRFLTGLINHGEKIRRKPKQVLAVMGWSIVFQLCVVGVNYSIFRGMHFSNISWFDAMYIIPATSVAAMLPLGINGYGVREGAYVLLLTPFGIHGAGAFASSVIFAFLVSICSLWGGWVWLKRNNTSYAKLYKQEEISL